jgi:hypothetical protein
MNTGTPIAEKRSASNCRVIVLPVPGGAGDQAVPVGQRRQQGQFGVFVPGDEHEGFAMGDSGKW